MTEQSPEPGFAEQLANVVSATTAPPPFWMLLTMVALGVTLSLSENWFRHANVVGLIVHEAGHAALALPAGGRVLWIQLHNTDSGVTWSSRPRGLPSVLVSFAGYAAPPLAGLGVAALIAGGKAPLVLALGVVLMVLVLIVSRAS